MSRHRFKAYLDKVFGFSDLVHAMPEGRQFPRHPWQKVFDAVFLGAAMQVPSLLQIEAECRSGALAKRIGPISDDTIGYALQRQSPEPVFALGCEVARRLKRNAVLRSDWSRGLLVAAVDGIEICSSFARCCDACLQREVQPATICSHARGRCDTFVVPSTACRTTPPVSLPTPLLPYSRRSEKGAVGGGLSTPLRTPKAITAPTVAPAGSNPPRISTLPALLSLGYGIAARWPAGLAPYPPLSDNTSRGLSKSP